MPNSNESRNFEPTSLRCRSVSFRVVFLVESWSPTVYGESASPVGSPPQPISRLVSTKPCSFPSLTSWRGWWDERRSGRPSTSLQLPPLCSLTPRRERRRRFSHGCPSLGQSHQVWPKYVRECDAHVLLQNLEQRSLFAIPGWDKWPWSSCKIR